MNPVKSCSWFPVALIYICVIIILFSMYYRENDSNYKRFKDWDLFPPHVQYGIITGATSNLFSMTDIPSAADYNTCILKLYALEHGYAFKVEKNLGGSHLSNRTYGKCLSSQMSPWNKIPLMQKYLNDVGFLVWFDVDAIITDFKKKLENLFPSKAVPQSICLPLGYMNGSLGNSLKRRRISYMPGAMSDPFLWLAKDINPSYLINVNSAVMALRNCNTSKLFLDLVWRFGGRNDSHKLHGKCNILLEVFLDSDFSVVFRPRMERKIGS